MKRIFNTIAGGLLMGIVATTGAEAVSYKTIIDYVPEGIAGSSLDPADGNKIVVDWETDLLAGLVQSSDLLNLTLTLFGNGTQLYQDMAIINNVVQDIAGVSRTFDDVWFSFADVTDLNSLFYIDNDRYVVQSNSTGITYNLYGGDLFGDFIYAYRKLDGSTIHPESTLQENGSLLINTTTQPQISAVPLPAALPLYAGGLFLIGFIAKRKKRIARQPA